MLSRVDFIAEQLKGLAPSAEWNMGGVDRLRELAAVFERNGITDLWRLKLIPVESAIYTPGAWVETESDRVWIEPRTEQIRSFAFEYEGKRFGFMGGPDEIVNDPYFEPNDPGYVIAWSARGRGNVSYVVRPNAAKTALEIVPVWASSSDAGFIRGSLMFAVSFFASVLLPVIGTAAGAAVGSAVVPASFAAAYPGVTAAIGNIAISTALNGGNVENAVKSAALGYVGATAGGFANSAALSVTDSTIAGRLADVAARTAIMGGDIKTAVGMELLGLGASGMLYDTSLPGSSFEVMPYTGFGSDFNNPVVDLNIPVLQFEQPYTFDFPTDFGFPTGGGLTLDPQPYDAFTWNPFVNDETALATAAAQSGVATAPTAPTVPPPPQSPVYNPSELIKGISNVALQTLAIVRAYRQLDTPVIQQTARTVRSNGAVAVIGDNGLIQTRQPNGQVTAARPPVGIPQATTNGNYIVNNGDGSYNIVSPTGQNARYSYSSDAPAGGLFGGVSPWVIGAGVVGLLYVMKRK